MSSFTFKKRVPVREADAFMEALGKVEQGKVRTFIPVLAYLVESWEYEGKPTDPEAYEDLDLFREFIPLAKAAEAFISETMGNR